MKNRDFIITSLQSWDIEIGSAIKNKALEISKNNRVLYINTPLDYKSRYFGVHNSAWEYRMKVIRGEVPAIRKVKDNLWVADFPFTLLSINKLPNAWLFDKLNWINNRKMAEQIKKFAAELNFENFFHIIDTDIYRSQYMKELLGAATTIYYCRDYVIGEKYWKRHGARLEPKIAAKVDFVINNSDFYAERMREYNAKSYTVEMGVDLSLYDINAKYITPEDMKNIPHPIVGYMGTINSTRLDGDLLMALAKKRPNISFVFTGPEDSVYMKHQIHSLPNVYFLGKKPIKELSAYINEYDVCINPQFINKITEGNYPLKIDEYLAMGKPVVATNTYTMRGVFSQHVHLATTEDDYLEAIDRALNEINDREKQKARVEFAHTHSWENSIKKLYSVINMVENGSD